MSYKFNKEDKWKLISHLQKSIRKGLKEEAYQAARWSYSVDPTYTIYRMAVIAFEDVAGASPDVVVESMEKGWKRKNIEENLGGIDFIGLTAMQWADTVKDRIANEFCSCFLWYDRFTKTYGDVNKLGINDLSYISWNHDIFWAYRGIAAWAIAGSKLYPNKILNDKTNNWDKWIELNVENGVDENVIKCMDFGSKTQNEGSPIFLGFVNKAIKEEKAIIKENKKILMFDNIGPYLSSAIDKHTREGKQAISYFLHRRHDIVDWFIKKGLSYDDCFRTIGKIQFMMEGGQLNKFYDYPTKNKIEKDLKLELQESLDINGSELFKLIGNINQWHDARVKVLNIQGDI